MYSQVYVEITNICNMNCSFCHGHSRAPRQMTEGEYARVLEQLSGKTQYIYHHLMGEPLTHPLLPRFKQYQRVPHCGSLELLVVSELYERQRHCGFCTRL